MNIATIAGASHAGFPNLTDLGLAVGGGVNAGLLLRRFDSGMVKPYQIQPPAGVLAWKCDCPVLEG